MLCVFIYKYKQVLYVCIDRYSRYTAADVFTRDTPHYDYREINYKHLLE